jgi:glycine/D-amino acid oxidase-like deaminating enzyme
VSFPPLQTSRAAEVLVIGAGVAGSALALELARRGGRPLVLEAGTLGGPPEVGHVRVGLAEPFAQVVARLGRGGARQVWEHHRASRERLEAMLVAPGRDCAYRRAGGFRLAESRGAAEVLAESEDLLREDGFSGEFFDHYMLETRFDVRGFAAAYWAADDAELETDTLVERLAAEATRAGAVIHEHTAVVGLEPSAAGTVARTDRGVHVEADLVAVSAGAGSAALVPQLANRLRTGLLVPSPASTVSGDVDWRAVGTSLLARTRGAADPLPRNRLGGPARVDHVSAGTESTTVDGLPLVGRLEDPPALVACGFAGASLGVAFEAARWLAEAVAGHDVVPRWWRPDREPLRARARPAEDG